MNLLFLGASNTDCGHCFTPDNLGTGYVKYVFEQLTHTDGSAFHIVNGGTDGFTFRRIYEKWQRTYSGEQYDAVILLGGINEVGMIHNTSMNPRQAEACFQDASLALSSLLQKLSSPLTKHIVVMEPFLFDTPAYLNVWLPELAHMRTLIRDCITRYHGISQIHYLPLQQKLDALVHCAGSAAVTSDGLHLTETGHRCIADTLTGLLLDIL